MSTYDYVLFTGQSLARGQLNSGVPTDLAGAQANPTYIKQLNASGVLSAMEAPDLINSYSGIVPARSFADAAWKGAGNYLVVNTHAEGGQSYTQLKKGTAVYNAAIDALTDGVTVNTSDSFVARALHIIHGEADSGATQAQYLGYLIEWLSDYNTDMKAITGQSANMVAFFSPPSTYGLTAITQAALQAHREQPDIYLVCPKYNLGTTLHLEGPGYFHLGEYHARAHAAVINNGGDWNPLMPLSARANGTTISVTFSVPVAPLVFNTSEGTWPNYGFVVLDNAGTKTISSVSIVGDNRVDIVVTTALGVNPRVRYATSGGNLCDSEPAVSAYDGAALPNWCVHFEETIIPTPQSPAVRFRSAATIF